MARKGYSAPYCVFPAQAGPTFTRIHPPAWAFLFGNHNVAANRDDIKYVADALRRLHSLCDKIAQFIIIYEQTIATEHTMRESIIEQSRDIDNIYDVSLVILDKLEHLTATTDKQSRRLTAELREEMLDRRRRSIQRQLLIQQDNLNELEERAAEQGNRPTLDTMNQIIRTKDEIARLQNDLQIFHKRQ